MDFLKDIFSPFTERAKSPFFGSFIIYWLIINWRIVFIIFFASNKDLHQLNIVDFLESQEYFNRDYLFNYPMLATFFYLFIWPIIDLTIFRIAEERKRIKIDEKIRIGREYSVNGKLYYDLKFDFEEERKKVLEFENKKTEYLSNIEQLQNELVQNRMEQKQIISESDRNIERIKVLESRNSTKFLEGRWQLTYRMKNGEPSIEDLEIKNHEYWIINGTDKQWVFQLDLIDYDPLLNRISFIKFYHDQKDKEGVHSFAYLRIVDKDTLEGNENYSIQVQYKRKYYDHIHDKNKKNSFETY